MSSFIEVSHSVMGGKGTIIRTTQSGDVWQVRIWIPTERKYVRKSLKTKDLDTAFKRAEEKIFEIYSDMKSGRKIFGIILNELVNEYVLYRSEDVIDDTITAGRLTTIKSQLKHFLRYKGENTKVSELDNESCYEYARWCRSHREGVKDVTIRNEQATLNHMIKWAYRKGFSHFNFFEFRVLRVRSNEDSRRGVFTLEQYDELVRKMRLWISKKSCSNDEVLRNERFMIRDCILIASNSMLRVGELWQLRWKDVIKFEDIVDDIGYKHKLVTVKVRAETSKVRKERTITVRGGEYVERLKKHSIHTEPNDYIFCGVSGSERFPKKKFYGYWHELMEMVHINYKEDKISWYSLRHFGITCRLLAGATATQVGMLAGTGTTFIDNHYGHLNEEIAKSVAMKNFHFDKDGIREH